jgi:radical SAM superfamily enzyme YgiQ (UPF0313 family)
MLLCGADLREEAAKARRLLFETILPEALAKHEKKPEPWSLAKILRKKDSGPDVTESLTAAYEAYVGESELLEKFPKIGQFFLRETVKALQGFGVKKRFSADEKYLAGLRQRLLAEEYPGMEAAIAFPISTVDRDMGELLDEYNPFGGPVLPKIFEKISDPEDKQILFVDRCLYFNRDIYREFPQAPPSSSTPNTLRLEAATGCSWNKCAYCDLYEEEKLWLTKPEEFRGHIRKVKDFLGNLELIRFERIFLTGGNALSIPTARLLEMLADVRKEFGKMRRIECYATTADILKKGPEDLRKLREAGLNLVYWGVESGSDEVLEYVRKQHRKEDVLLAGKSLLEADIRASVTVMPGLGGKKFSEAHVTETAEIVAGILPQYVTLMGINVDPASEYAAMMESPDNRALNKDELREQTRSLASEIGKRLDKSPSERAYDIKIAAYSSDITPTAKNAYTFVMMA